MTEEVKERFDWLPLVWALLFCGWLFGIPILLLQSAAAVPFMGIGSPGDYARRDSLQTWAGIVAVALPLIGFALAAVFRRKFPAILFGVILLVVGGLFGVQAMYRAQHQPNPPNDHHVCQEHSGGDNVCPGD